MSRYFGMLINVYRTKRNSQAYDGLVNAACRTAGALGNFCPQKFVADGDCGRLDASYVLLTPSPRQSGSIRELRFPHNFWWVRSTYSRFYFDKPLLEDTAPTFCLSFDGDGARHHSMARARSLGIAHLATTLFVKLTTYP